MYDVNTERIDQVLQHMQRSIGLLQTLSGRGAEAVLADEVAVAAMERALHLAIEAVIDVGNLLIDGFIMRDPGSYADIVEILRDEQVIDDGQARQLTKATEFRRHLVNEYTHVPVKDMFVLVTEVLDSFRQFDPAVRAYLEKELF
ncbi:type VII toxin-antitoxin system HepT family RNase toxin [Brevibacillus sp. TJ4]|uniref:type VII toxin-antitoxin system HepT family RNase toxin n=1 Tax=Brevibacillus sp. TJ4 TaxID=3234853 RepID=UPI003B9E3AC3